MKITYFNVQRSCLQDGPGIRTTLFLKGCPLNCVWCHNPEGKSPENVLMFRSDRCVLCGRCLGLCVARKTEDGVVSVDRDICCACGQCVDACLSDCNEICGKESEADEIYDVLIRDKLFFDESGGGITVSGGEPLAQRDAVIYLAGRAKDDGVGFAVETSGFCDTAPLLELAKLGCLFLYDIKGIDSEKHAKNTGAPNEAILSNLEALAEYGADIILRMPLVPGYNDGERDLELLSEFLSEYKGRVRRAEIMPYHRIGLGKAAALGMADEKIRMIPDGRASVERWTAALSGPGVPIKVN